MEALTKFRVEVLKLYKGLEEDLVEVSKKYGFEVNMWYSPSNIPQPNFKAGKLSLDVERLYHERNFKELIEQHYPVWNSAHSSTAKEGTLNRAGPMEASMASVDLIKKDVELREEKRSPPYELDMKESGGDLRVRKAKSGRRGTY